MTYIFNVAATSAKRIQCILETTIKFSLKSSKMHLSRGLIYWFFVGIKLRMSSNLYFATKNYLLCLFTRIRVKTCLLLVG